MLCVPYILYVLYIILLVCILFLVYILYHYIQCYIFASIIIMVQYYILGFGILRYSFYYGYRYYIFIVFLTIMYNIFLYISISYSIVLHVRVLYSEVQFLLLLQVSLIYLYITNFYIYKYFVVLNIRQYYICTIACKYYKQQYQYITYIQVYTLQVLALCSTVFGSTSIKFIQCI